MTCEVALLNKFGAAIAADSAVTMGDGKKIYHHSRKLFSFHPATPVAILTYGSAEIMGVPWAVVIQGFCDHVGAQRFGQLQDYADQFTRYVESASHFFSDQDQRAWLKLVVSDYWQRRFLGNDAGAPPTQARQTRHNLLSALPRAISEDRVQWSQYPDLTTVPSTFGDEVCNRYGSELRLLETELFKGGLGESRLRAELYASVKSMYQKEWFSPVDGSWVVFVGFGDREPFPSLLELEVGSIAADRLRFKCSHPAAVTREDAAMIVPLAQRRVIDMFYSGIDPLMQEKVADLLEKVLQEQLAGLGLRKAKEKVEQGRAQFLKRLTEELQPAFASPMVDAVSMMSEYNLARTAEALVNMTVLRKKLSVDEKETVGGAVNVAVVSRSGGFQWVKRDAPSFPVSAA